MRATWAAGLAAGLVALAGCGGTGQCEVEGSVSFDGVPIDSGAIAFLGGGGPGGRNAGGAIVDGKYRIPAETGPVPGTYKVEIRWQKKTGKKFKSDAGEFDDAKEGLPDKYHEKTELTAEIKAGKNVVNYDLKK